MHGETTTANLADEAAIRQLVQDMQDGQYTKNGELFASAFAQEHYYVAIIGMLLPNQTRDDNARSHQRPYDDVEALSPGSTRRWMSG